MAIIKYAVIADRHHSMHGERTSDFTIDQQGITLNLAGDVVVTIDLADVIFQHWFQPPGSATLYPLSNDDLEVITNNRDVKAP